MIIPAIALATWAIWRAAKKPTVKIRPDGSTAGSAAATLARAAARPCDQAKIPLSVCVAIGMAETGYGRAVPGNNWFGIRGVGPAGSVTVPTKEELRPGKIERMKGKFRRYPDAAAAALDWTRFVSTSRYKPAWKMDRGGAVLWIWSMGYSTASNWPRFVAAISRGVAKRLAAPAFAFELTPQQLALAKKLATIPAGSKRRAAARAVYEAGKWPTKASGAAAGVLA